MPRRGVNEARFAPGAYGYHDHVSPARIETLAASGAGTSRDPMDAVELELPRGRRFAPVARLVAAGLGARLGLRVDRIEDLELAVDAALRQPRARDTLTLAMTPTREDLRVEVGPLAAYGLDSRGLEGVLSSLVDEIRTHRSGEEFWIAMRFTPPSVAASRWPV